MKDVTFGQYYPADSFVHKMDPRAKLLLTIAYIVAVFLVQSWHFLGFVACLAFLVVVVIASKVPVSKTLKSIKAIIFLVILSAILQIFFNKGGKVLWQWSFITITSEGLLNAGYITCRLLMIVMGASILTLTTSPVEISDAIESLLMPLKYVKFPVHEFALIMSIALRFIPTLLEETDRIINAQKARGAQFESRNFFKKVKALIPVLIPLLISSFRRADELADAMDARCYAGSTTRTKYKKLHFTWRDLIGLILVTILIVGVVYLNKFYIILG